MTITALARFEAGAAALLGAGIDALSWPVGVLDAGLRLALSEYNEAAPAVETVFTVAAAGYVQDLGTGTGAIADLRRVAAIGWPFDAAWNASERPTLWARWVVVDGSLIRFLDVSPGAGDCFLVRYWRGYFIDGLDVTVIDPGGPAAPRARTTDPETTNVPLRDQFLVCLGAAGHTLTVRLRQLSEQPGVPDGTAAELGKVRDGLLAGFATGLAGLSVGAREGGVSWGNIGL